MTLPPRQPGAAKGKAALTAAFFKPLPDGELKAWDGHGAAGQRARPARRLPGPHRDPFDRMLMAQAQTERADVVTVDPVFRDYGVAVVW